jgi:hypothetical protein
MCSDIHYLHTISQNVNPNTILTSYYSQEVEGVKAPLNALVDTGALHGNYINQNTFEILSSMGVVSEDISIKVCAAFNECQTSTKAVTILLHFNVNNEHNLKSFSASLSFSVLHTLPYDLIIGRKSIILYDLWNKTLVVDPTMFQLPPVRLRRLKSATKTSKKPTRVRKPLRAPTTLPEQQTKNQLHLQNTVEVSTAIQGRPPDVAHQTTRTAEVVTATTNVSTPHPSPVDTKNKGPAALFASERVEIMKETRIPTCPRGTRCRCPWLTPCNSIGRARMRDAYNAAVSSEIEY